jgi:GNAT superfamily N-acetyltransferase
MDGRHASATIIYTTSLAGITPERLQGFFVGWPQPPSPATHLLLLAGSQAIVLALDGVDGPVVGFVTAVSDWVSCAYIPHLEVLPAFRGQGIGTTLMRRILDRFAHLYMTDLLCDPALQPFYARLGMQPWTGMLLRRYEHQAGASLPPGQPS